MWFMHITYDRKTKDCLQSWTFHKNRGIFVCSFEVWRALKLFQSASYELTDL